MTTFLDLTAVLGNLYVITMLLLGCRHQCVDAVVEACWALLGLGLHHPTGREQSPPIADFHWEAPDPSSSPLKVAQAPICFVYHTLCTKVFSKYLTEMSVRHPVLCKCHPSDLKFNSEVVL